MAKEDKGAFRPEDITSHTEIVSLRSRVSHREAARLAKQGLPIGAYNRGVCAIWGDGANPAFPEAVARIKGEIRGQRPLAASITTEQFVKLLDPDHISPNLHSVFLEAGELAARTSSLCFIRGPITKEAARKLPVSIVSNVNGIPVVQNWDAKGHRPTHRLLQTMRRAGIEYPAVTSMNESGSPEIVDQEEGKIFSQAKGIPLFLEDRRDPKKAVGSYTILGISEAGVGLIREGNIPSNLLKELLGTEIDTSSATTAKSVEPLAFPAEKIEGLNPRVARIAILSSLRGQPAFLTETILKTGDLIKK